MVDHGMISPDWKPLITLLNSILRRREADLGDYRPVCLSVAAGHTRAPDGTGLVGLTSLGEGTGLLEAQIEHGGPVLDAVTSGYPVSTPDVWTDQRWPVLTRALPTARVSDVIATRERITGMAVVPSGWDDGGLIALCCCLATPADEQVLEVMDRYEPLVTAALAVTHATTLEGPDHVLNMLRSRAVIEQAKAPSSPPPSATRPPPCIAS